MTTLTGSVRPALLALAAGALLGVFGAAYIFKDLLVAGRFDALWANQVDPALMNWIVSWGHRALFELRDPASFWNANSFYPNEGTLAYSDSLIGLLPVYSPLRLMGMDSLPALYAALALTCVAACALTVWLLRDIGAFSWPECIFIAFAAHFGLSMTAYLYHHQLFAFQLAPPFLLSGFSYLRGFRRRYLLSACAVFVWACLIAAYFAPMVATVSLFAFAPLLLEQVRRADLAATLREIGWGSAACIMLSLGLLYVIQFRPYLVLERPPQALIDTAIHSAGIFAIVSNVSLVAQWYKPMYVPPGSWEWSYFPGIALLTLSSAACLLWLARLISRRARPRPSADAPAPPLELQLGAFAVCALVSCVVLSYGPYFKPLPEVKFPFHFLSMIVPGLDSVRAPGRFGIMIGLPLAILGVLAFHHIRDLRRRRWATWGAIAVLVFESLPAFPVLPFSVDPERIYARVAQEIEPGTPVLELPVFDPRGGIETIMLVNAQLNGSTVHWARLASGYGAFSSPQYAELLALDQDFQTGRVTPDAVVAFAKRLEMPYLLLHLDGYTPERAERWREWLQACDCESIFDHRGSTLVRFRYAPPQRTRRRDTALQADLPSTK